MTQLFDLTGRVAAITGGAGLLGRQHAEAIAACGGIPVLVDIVNADRVAAEIAERRHVPAFAAQADITRPESVRQLLADILERFGRLDILTLPR
jgi:NAD(P)-dependent dehydrogenase (short-subunit alcohol dehydrogenase family)